MPTRSREATRWIFVSGSPKLKRRLNLPRLEVVYFLTDPARRIPEIVEGKADMECGSTTNTAERRQQVSFTGPHYLSGARYLVRSDSAISHLPDFQRKRLAGTRGTVELKAIERASKERLLYIDIVEVPDHAKAVEMVEAGEVDGFAMADVLLYGLRSNRPNPDKLKVVGKLLTIDPIAIMFNKDDLELKGIIDAEMKRLIHGREAHAIYEKWFMQPIPPRNVPLNMPMNYLLNDFWKYPSDQGPF